MCSNHFPRVNNGPIPLWSLDFIYPYIGKFKKSSCQKVFGLEHRYLVCYKAFSNDPTRQDCSNYCSSFDLGLCQGGLDLIKIYIEKH